MMTKAQDASDTTLRVGKTQAWLLLDGALSAVANVSILLLAARLLGPSSLSDFAIVQLTVTTVQALQRATILAPALASQRQQGRGVVPFKWLLFVTLPATFVGGAVSIGYLALAGGELGEWAVPLILSQAAILILDLCRYRLFSVDKIQLAVVADSLNAVALVALFAIALLGGGLPQDDLTFTLWCWAGSLGLAMTSSMLFSALWRGRQINILRLPAVWKLGKWSGLDQLMSAFASIAPLVVTGLALGYEFAGTYRVLQSALGPLNILSTAISTRLGLTSWTLNDRSSLDRLDRTVRKMMLGLSIFTALYVVVAEVMVVLAAELSGPELLRIGLVVGVCGILGSLTVPLSAASAALGYQRYGALIRVLILGGVSGITLAALCGWWLPWNDPIGTAALFASATGLAGWSVSYLRARATERKLVVTY